MRRIQQIAFGLLVVLLIIRVANSQLFQTIQVDTQLTSVPIHMLNNLLHDNSDNKYTQTIDTLKQKISTIQKNKKNDLVFLVDSSSSVGNHNFRSEVKFVRKILNGFNVSWNYTRVAIVAFSSAGKVVSTLQLR